MHASEPAVGHDSGWYALIAPVLHKAAAASVTKAAARIIAARADSAITKVYYYGRYYPYRYRDGHDPYRYEGEYYRYRHYHYGRWLYD